MKIAVVNHKTIGQYLPIKFKVSSEKWLLTKMFPNSKDFIIVETLPTVYKINLFHRCFLKAIVVSHIHQVFFHNTSRQTIRTKSWVCMLQVLLGALHSHDICKPSNVQPVPASIHHQSSEHSFQHHI